MCAYGEEMKVKKIKVKDQRIESTLLILFMVVLISWTTWAIAIRGDWKMNLSELKIFFGIYGVVFAFTAGFVLFQAVEFHRALKQSIHSELNALQDMRDFLFYLDCKESTIESIRMSLHDYVSHIVSEEWPRLVMHQAIPDDTTRELRKVIKSVHKIDVQNESDQVALQLLVETIRDITTFRTTRVNAAATRMPRSLKALLITLSFCLLVSVCIIPYSIPWIGAVLNGFIALAVTFICLTIFDLDDPFHGSWKIAVEPFEELLKTLDELHLEDIDHNDA